MVSYHTTLRLLLQRRKVSIQQLELKDYLSQPIDDDIIGRAVSAAGEEAAARATLSSG
jgi:hypothetical protein